LEHQKRVLEAQKAAALEAEKIRGQGLAEELALLKYYDGLLSGLESKITAAKEIETSIPGGGGAQSKDARATVSGQAANDKSLTEEAKLAQEIALTLQQTLNKAISSVNATMDSAVQKWVSGAETFSKAWQGAARSMEQSIVKSLILVIAKTLEYYALQALGVSVQAATTAHTQLLAAKAAAANTYAQVSAIPVVGPFLAPPAAAVAFAAVLAFKEGGIMGDEDGFAMLKKKEMVLPEHVSQAVLNVAGSTSKGLPQQGGGGHTFNLYHQGYPGQSKRAMRSSASADLDALQKEARLRHVSLGTT
jgi:hypothetical protein